MTRMVPEPDPFLAALRAEEEKAEEEKALAADEDERIRQQIHPNSWTVADAHRLKDRLPRPQGFLEDDQLLRRGNVSLIVGPGGVRKTWFEMFMLGQIVLEQKVNDWIPRQGSALFLSEELDRDTMLERMRILWPETPYARQLGEGLRVRCRSNLDFYARTSESVARVKRIWDEEGRPDVIGIDALTYIHHGNEGSNQDMGVVFGAIKDISAELNCHIQVIHHYGKPSELRTGTDKIRGATVMRDICSDIFLVEPEDRERSNLVVGKHRDWSRAGAPVGFNFGLDPNPQDPNCRILTFRAIEDKKKSNRADASSEAVTEFVSIVKELAGDAEVLRGAVEERLKWGHRKFDEVAATAVGSDPPLVCRVKRGRETSYYIPRGVDGYIPEG